MFWREKGDGKNFWGQERGILIFLDAIEILSICNIIENQYTSEVPYFLVQWSWDVFIINSLNCNVFLLCAVNSSIYIIIISFTFILLL